jgi:uncharacterized protein involved in exopolysaccharide biosynthesis
LVRDVAARLEAETGVRNARQDEAAERNGPPRLVNPAEVARQNQLRSLRGELSSLDAQLAGKEAEELRLRGAIASYQAKVDAAPTRESEMVELTRDYATLQSLYTSLLAKREDSKLAANLERRQVGEQFKVLDPARVPETPFSPNRLQMNVIGTAAGLAFGLALVGLLEYRDRTLKKQEDVIRVLQLPVLAVVPLMPTPGAGRAWWRRPLGSAAAVVLIVLAAAVAYAAWARQAF